MMEPIGSLMISQYQACKPNNSDVQKDYSSANINHFIEQETIKKMNAVTNVSKSTFDKSNENNDFNSKSKKEFLEKDKKRIKENIDYITDEDHEDLELESYKHNLESVMNLKECDVHWG